jgi:hypothetical protein
VSHENRLQRRDLVPQYLPVVPWLLMLTSDAEPRAPSIDYGSSSFHCSSSLFADESAIVRFLTDVGLYGYPVGVACLPFKFI